MNCINWWGLWYLENSWKLIKIRFLGVDIFGIYKILRGNNKECIFFFLGYDT